MNILLTAWDKTTFLVGLPKSPKDNPNLCLVVELVAEQIASMKMGLYTTRVLSWLYHWKSAGIVVLLRANTENGVLRYLLPEFFLLQFRPSHRTK